MALTTEQETTVKIISDTIVKATAPAVVGFLDADKIKARLDYFDLLAKRQKYPAVIREAVVAKLEKSEHF